jgi:hypothetical protein
MSAREKLNGVYITACFIFAGLIGAAAESFVVFVIVFGILFAVHCHDGSIRLTPVHDRRRRRTRKPRRR